MILNSEGERASGFHYIRKYLMYVLSSRPQPSPFLPSLNHNSWVLLLRALNNTHDGGENNTVRGC